MYGFIADAIAVLHLVFVIFVVLGVLAVRRWPRIAWLHIPAVLWAAYVETTGSYCPLTPWETRYRELAGEHAYSGDFVGNYILPMLYPAGLTRGIQIALGLAVLAGNGLVYLLLARRQSMPRGGWSGGHQSARPAAEHDLRYGDDLLLRESGQWPQYFMVSSPRAHEAARPQLTREPAVFEYASTLDWSHLQAITDRVPKGTELIIGLGGGVALDASKYVALKKGLPLILVPSIVSTGAIIHSIFAKWNGHGTVGVSDTWPWIDFDYVIVDTQLVLKAPYHLNTAGFGDILCGYSGFCEWRRNARLGIGESFDESAVAVAAGHYEHITSGFPQTLDDAGDLTADSVRFIMQAVQERDAKNLRHPEAVLGDHALWLAAEEINDRGWVHGEFLALASVIIAWHCNEGLETLTGWLDTCKVRWHPGDMGVSREELRRALEFVPEFMADSSRGFDLQSILRTEPIDGERFSALWEFLSEPAPYGKVAVGRRLQD